MRHPQQTVVQHRLVVVLVDEDDVLIRDRAGFAAEDILLNHLRGGDVRVARGREVVHVGIVVGEGAVGFERGPRAQTEHVAVAGQRKPPGLDVDGLPQRVVHIVVVHQPQFDGLIAVVDVERLVDVAFGIGRDDLALDHDVVVDHHAAAQPLGAEPHAL